MSDQKIVIPEAMLEAVAVVVRKELRFGSMKRTLRYGTSSEEIAECAAEAAIRWMIEDWKTSPNARRMPEPWYSKCRQKWNEFTPQWKENADIDFVDLLVFFGNRMMERFVSQELEVPEDIKDLLIPIFTLGEEVARPLGTNSEYNHAIIEAFHRGQQSKETK